MFNKKYSVTLLDSKWQIITKNLKFDVIPKKDEFIWFENEYFEVINIIHSFNNQHSILIVVKELSDKALIKEVKF